MNPTSTERVDPLPELPQCVFVRGDGHRCMAVPKSGEQLCGIHLAGLGSQFTTPRKCAECDVVGNPGVLARHQKANGHVGWVKAPEGAS